MKRRRLLATTFLHAALIGASACGGATSPPVTTLSDASARPAPDACAGERQHARDLAEDGRIARALTVLETADQRCPKTAHLSLGAKQTLLAELSSQTPALELVREGMGALAEGDRSGAQREFDRALLSWRRQTGHVERVALLAAGRDDSVGERFTLLAAEATPDNRWVTVIVDATRPGRMSHVVGRNGVEATEAGGLVLRVEPALYLERTGSNSVVLEPLHGRIFTADGRHIVGVRDGQLVVVAAASGQRTAQVALGDDFQLSPFRPLEVVGERLLVFGYRPHATESLVTFSFPDLASRHEVTGAHLAVHPNRAHVAAFEPTTAPTTTLRSYDLRSGLLQHTATCRPPRDGAAGSAIAISPDGSTVATVVGDAEIELLHVAANTTHVVRVPTGAEHGALSTPRFTDYGARLCVVRAGALPRVLDVRTRRLLAAGWTCGLEGKRALAVELPLSPGHELVADLWDGSSVVALSDDGRVAAAVEMSKRDPSERWLLVFEATGRRVRVRLRVDERMGVQSVRIRDGVVQVGYGEEYDVVTGARREPRPIAPRVGGLTAAEVLPSGDGGWAVQIAASTVVWRDEGSFHAWRLPDTTTKVMSDAVCGVAASSDGRFVAATPSCAAGGEARVWDMRDGRLVTRRAVPTSGEIVAVSASGRWLAFATGEVLQVLNTATGELSRVELTHKIMALAISPDERHLAVHTRSNLSLCRLDAPADVKWSSSFGLSMFEIKFANNGRYVGALDALLDVGGGAWRHEVPGLSVVRGGAASFMALPGAAPAGLSLSEPIVLTDSIASVQATRWSLAGGLLVAATDGSHAPDGTVEVHDLVTRERRALLVPLPHGALVFLPGGFVDWLGAPAEPQGLVCQAGAEVFPFAVCRERWQLPGGLARAWRGEPLPAASR